MKHTIDEGSIYHVANEHDLARTYKLWNASRSSIMYIDGKPEWWLSIVAAHPKIIADDFTVSTEENRDVNCHGHALGLDKWVDPAACDRSDLWWPDGIQNSRLISTFVQLFKLYGFRVTDSPIAEPGFDRIALWRKDSVYCSHSARQLADGRWSSKMGVSVVVSGHSLGSLNRRIFGEPAVFMRRRRVRSESDQILVDNRKTQA